MHYCLRFLLYSTCGSSSDAAGSNSSSSGNRSGVGGSSSISIVAVATGEVVVEY